jgi:hypothetical protein
MPLDNQIPLDRKQWLTINIINMLSMYLVSIKQQLHLVTDSFHVDPLFGLEYNHLFDQLFHQLQLRGVTDV